MKILVLGGTRYFGKRLVDLLLKEGHQITLATRGNTQDTFGNRVQRKKMDRTNIKSVREVAEADQWDIVYDQICYNSNDAQAACESFKGRVGRYIHTSTCSVYPMEGDRQESDFDPFSYTIRMGGASDFDYGEGKRQAEAVFFQRASFPVAAMRIPIVLGPDDYTGRLEFHINRVREERSFVVPNMEARTSFARSSEAARFLLWLGFGSMTGPFNACSNGQISMIEILGHIEKRVGKKAKVLSTGPDEDANPFLGTNSRTTNTAKARDSGFIFDEIQEWFPKLVDELSARQSVSSSR